MFKFEDVTFKDILSIPALYVAKDRITSLTGPSGGGKTTLLKLMNKMLSPTGGHILFNGTRLDQIDSVLHRRRVTMLSQSPAMFDGSIKENLTVGLRLQKRDVPSDSTLTEMLKSVRLDMELDMLVHTLSGGEKQRLALARVLLLDSDVYLLDEPSSALDEATAEAVIEMITCYARDKGKTLIMVTHSKSIAQRYSDEIIEVSRGTAAGGRNERNS